MALEYRKLAHLTDDVTAGTLTAADVVASVTADELEVVNIKGRMLTAAQVAAHLAGILDGETVVRP